MQEEEEEEDDEAVDSRGISGWDRVRRVDKLASALATTEGLSITTHKIEESFHLPLARFIPGSSASAVNFQAFLLDGITC